MYAIETNKLGKRYGNKNVVNNLSLAVPQGAIYGFIGRNGSGKSTTQKMVCGLINSTEGEVKLFGRALQDKEARKQIGTIIEQPGLYPGMSALENVILQGYNIGVENPRKSALESLETVGLGKFSKKKAKHLSLGMKQRLGIAIAMLGKPELLVLDEPINGLDPEGITGLREVIEKLNREEGITIFMSSHILGELSKLATHYGIIKDGELVEQTTAKGLAEKRNDYIMVRVNNHLQATTLLEDKLGLHDYKVGTEQDIYLYGTKDTGAINRLLSANGYDVMEIYLHQQDLDEYFIELMGEDKNEQY